MQPNSLDSSERFAYYRCNLPCNRLGFVQVDEQGLFFCLARRLLMTTPPRIALFIDAQNAYRRARDRFFPNPQSNVDGQFDSIKLGQLIASRGGPGSMPCSLSDVRLLRSAGPERDKRSHAAHMRQSNRWRANGATVIMQGLRYPPTWPRDLAEPKFSNI